MRTISLVVLLFTGVCAVFPQTALDKAKEELEEMDEVVHFSDDQKDQILIILKEANEAKDGMEEPGYKTKKEFLEARLDITFSARKQVYALFSPEQFSLYDKHSRDLQNAYLEQKENRDYKSEYNAGRQ